MEIPISNWTSIEISKKTRRMIKAIAKKYKTNEIEILSRLVEAEYEILQSDIRTYGNFEIK